jgi:tyrosinase
MSGLHLVLLKAERGPSPEMLPLGPRQVCGIYPLNNTSRFSQQISDLAPFWASQTGFWLSSGTTTTEALHYTYPEFNNLKPGEVQQAIANYVEQQYGGGGLQSILPHRGPGPIIPHRGGGQQPVPLPGGLGPIIPPHTGGQQPVPPAGGLGPIIPPHTGGQQPVPPASGLGPIIPPHTGGQQPTPPAGGLGPIIPPHVGEPQPSVSQGSHPRTVESGDPGRIGPSLVHDWTVRIHVKKYKLRQSFTVLIFLGSVPDDPSQWRKASSYVGSHAAFANGSAVRCANCRAQADVVTEGFVHLNRALGRHSGLSSYEPQVVSPYLRENLHWRVQGVRSCA